MCVYGVRIRFLLARKPKDFFLFTAFTIRDFNSYRRPFAGAVTAKSADSLDTRNIQTLERGLL